MFRSVSALLFLLATAHSASAASCDEASGVCVCTGTCPSFTAQWEQKSSGKDDATGKDYCISVKDADGSSVSMDDGSEVKINGKTYTQPYDSCDNAVASKSGAATSFQPAALLFATAVGALALN